MSRLMASIRSTWERDPRKNPNELVYVLLAIGALLFPLGVQVATRGSGSFLISQAADAGVYVLLAIGLNVVVGFAGLLDLGYAAFFAIGAYTYAFVASDHMEFTPIHQALHIPFWIALLVGMFAAAGAGAILGAPTLRLRGDKNEHFGFNAQTEQFEDLVKAGVIDPTKVTRTALQNAASIAGLMLTTEAMVSELPEEEGKAPMPGGMGGMSGMGM